MILDGHIHLGKPDADRAEFKKRLGTVGIGGGLVISQEPASFSFNDENHAPGVRLRHVLALTKDDDRLYPFFWIDPMEEDALKQVDAAVASGISGFKVICNRFSPGDPAAMAVFKAVAGHGKPILFHSGILWDGQPSSVNNRPAAFEALLEIKGLKFCLAHISWPWVDECVAVYGKFLNAYSRGADLAPEMFIDITPGTPEIYREDALTKLYKVGYDTEDNIIFGSDCYMENYSTGWTAEWLKRDGDILKMLGVGEEAHKKLYCDNLLRFVGVITEKKEKKSLLQAE